jgi:Tfp pilus assembly protein PilO
VNEINKFIAGLNENQKKLLVIAVVIVIAALFDRLLIGPTMSQLSSIQDDITKEEATIKQDMRFLGYKDRIAKESQEINPYLTQHKLTDNEMIAAFLNKIQNLATESKVNLVKINPAPGEQDADYWKYQADLECSGQLADVIAFMHSINSDTDLMKVDKFNFSGKKSDTDEIKATMTVEKIVVTDKPMPPKAQDANAPATNPPASP